MITQEIIRLLNNLLSYQRQQRVQAEQRGDVAAINLIDAQIAEAESALVKLQSAQA
jgi:hypothetical protein